MWWRRPVLRPRECCDGRNCGDAKQFGTSLIALAPIADGVCPRATGCADTAGTDRSKI